jgi:hypothetical protein
MAGGAGDVADGGIALRAAGADAVNGGGGRPVVADAVPAEATAADALPAMRTMDVAAASAIARSLFTADLLPDMTDGGVRPATIPAVTVAGE